MIYLLRHGLDDESFIGGWSDIGLIEEGVLQVKRTKEAMKDMNLSFNQIFSSDIKRARETAQIILEDFKVPITYDERLREQDKGILTGLNRYEAYQLYPDYAHGVDVDVRYPDGESLNDLFMREQEVLNWLFTQDDLLIITHRGVINMFYFALTNTPLSNNKELFEVSHASLHELDVSRKRIRKIFDPKGGR